MKDILADAGITTVQQFLDADFSRLRRLSDRQQRFLEMIQRNQNLMEIMAVLT